ncbi:phosphoglycerate kinase [Planctomycetota bacterium]
MKKRGIKDIEVQDKTVLVRADFNVPLDGNQNITDDSRIQATLPTIKYLLGQNSRVVAMSHMGRPKGKVVEELRLNPVARRLSEILQIPVVKTVDCIGPEVKKAVAQLPAGGLLLLENVRFHPEEKKNDETFSRELAALGEIFVLDAFGSAHRAHASVAGVPRFLPAAAGMLLEKEIEYFSMLTQEPQRPYVAIVGGAKVKDKIGVLANLINKVDSILIGGAMAYTFLQVQGIPIGDSRMEEESAGLAKDILEKAAAQNITFELPMDHICGDKFAPDTPFKICREIAAGQLGLDIGPETVAKYKNIIMQAKTVIWNGPMGVFEWENFSNGTLGVATAMSEFDGVSVVGGGDSVAALKEFGLEDEISHVSTGGGASLEFLEGRTLPGIAALPDQE